MKLLFPFILAALFSTQVLADEPAMHNCKQPPVPGKFASATQLKEIDKNTRTYKACMMKFADEQQEISKNATEVAAANKAHDAAEAAIKEFNDYMKLRNDRESGEN
ncbi:hypothetical protein [Solimicrobium silvestre]|uniref:Uncharacterized protein n=1 Tax=Solimicrobium silvestre TaxID=2099400 RepID=A0A2S9H2U6_9BURK|nr:hypothetical protein [Solimicrobium silvestre]PRC94186.1 hypothetical protein S2091_1359 [Solimicrobium silvestre]